MGRRADLDVYNLTSGRFICLLISVGALKILEITAETRCTWHLAASPSPNAAASWNFLRAQDE